MTMKKERKKGNEMYILSSPKQQMNEEKEIDDRGG